MQSTHSSEFNGPIRNTAGSLSCAECRRSKLKCDRNFPCRSCIRRGCADICPTGTMPPVKGDIALKARAQKLTAEVDMLKSRIGELESMIANGPRGDPRQPFHPSTDALTEQRRLPMTPSHAISDLLGAFPLGKKGHPYNISIFDAYMPTKRNAFHMAHQYYKRANFSVVIVSSDEFYNTILDVIYGPGDVPSLNTIHPHKLSIFFATLAVGGLCDEDSIIQELASLYDHVARAALSFLPVATSACRATVQSISIITCLLLNQEVEVTEDCWLINGINNRLVQQLEMHVDRDASTPNRTHEEVQSTRRIFWEVVSWDAWAAFMTGRPAYFSLKHIDCPYPDISVCRISNISSEGANWRYKFVASCIAMSLDHLHSLQQPPPYTSVLEIDTAIRSYPLPSYSSGVSSSDETEFSWSHDIDIASLQGMTISMVEMNLIFLHKVHLIEARKKNKEDPLSTPFRFSVQASANSASRIVRSLSSLYNTHSKVAYLSWLFWSALAIACATLGDIVIQSPCCKTAKASMKLLNEGVKLFERVTAPSRSTTARTTMKTIREQALQAILSSEPSTSGSIDPSKIAEGPFWMHQPTYRIEGDQDTYSRNSDQSGFGTGDGARESIDGDISNWNTTSFLRDTFQDI